MADSSMCLVLISLLWQLTEHLSKPKVTIGLQSNKNGTCTTNLTCSMANRGEDVTYSWEALEQAANQTVDGSILHVSWRRDEGDMTFICMARNPVSSNFSNPILVRKLCEGVPDSSVVFLHFLLVPILLSPVILGLALLSTRREKGKENYPKGRSSEYTLFHCADTKKDGGSSLTAHHTRHIQAV
ncbi:SLAM family member 7 isoform X6 [Lemur catta]|uniref:SLAM family member 7 isoform X6 n=1 Tax=Lemur catta TaxID=9447 RepID=UPI001E26C880|nr:SLAM family member 7 isoform X6 [Lemur catta]